MAPKRAPLKFRIKVEGTRYIRVTVSETKDEMWKELEKCHGERHRHELAATVYAPGAPDRGCVADIFFFWRGMRPWVIAHEATHAAAAVAFALKRPVEVGTNDEFLAHWVERITQRVLFRTQEAAL